MGNKNNELRSKIVELEKQIEDLKNMERAQIDGQLTLQLGSVVSEFNKLNLIYWKHDYDECEVIIKKMHLSLKEELLYAAFLCGLKPEGESLHRIQLFFVANKELNSKRHQSDYQKVLETAANNQGYWEYWPEKTSGEYRITQKGYEKALNLFGNIVQHYPPCKANAIHYSLEGDIGNTKVLIRTRGVDNTTVFINDAACDSAKDACRRLAEEIGYSINIETGSAVMALYDLALDYNFEMYWES